MTVHSASVTVPASVTQGDGNYATRSTQANCDSNEKGVSGGTNWTGESDSTELVTVLSTPVYDLGSKKVTGWRGRGGNDTTAAHDFQVYVVCSKSLSGKPAGGSQPSAGSPLTSRERPRTDVTAESTRHRAVEQPASGNASAQAGKSP